MANKTKTPATYLYTGWNADETKYIRDEEREIYVGMPCTFSVGSDAYPAFVSRISDSGKNIWIKRASYTPDEGYDYFSNQVNIITPNDNAEEERVSKRKYGNWMMGSYARFGFGVAKHYNDPHF